MGVRDVYNISILKTSPSRSLSGPARSSCGDEYAQLIVTKIRVIK